MSFIEKLLSRGDLQSQEELLATPTAHPTEVLDDTVDGGIRTLAGAFELEAAQAATGASAGHHTARRSSFGHRHSSSNESDDHSLVRAHSSGPSPAAASRFTLANLLGSSSPHSVATLGRSSLDALSSPSMSRHSPAHAHREAAHSLHLSTTLSDSAHDDSSLLISPTQKRRLSAATSLVPRHDYIPSHPHRAVRPAASPPPSASKHHPSASSYLARSASLPSSPLIPIAPPASFVPPSPVPLTSPYKSILRTAHQTTDGHGVVQPQPQQHASPMKAHSAPAAASAGSLSATSSPHRPRHLHQYSEHTLRSADVVMSEDSIPSTQPTEPAASSSQSGSSLEATQSDHSTGATHMPMEITLSEVSTTKELSPEPDTTTTTSTSAQHHALKRSLRPSLRNGKEGEEKEEKKEAYAAAAAAPASSTAAVAASSSLHPPTKRRRGSNSVDLTNNGAVESFHVRMTLKPAAAAATPGGAGGGRVTRYSASVPPSRDLSPERGEEHKSAFNPAALQSVGELMATPSRKHPNPLSASPFAPHSAPSKSAGGGGGSASSSHSHRPRVRFDRAEIHEFDLVPDASKVPGGDGEYAVGMERTPHTSWVASLDAYEQLRATQRKVDGPEAIEEVQRRAIWLEAQRRAERWNETQRRKSGLKRLNEKQERQLEGARKRRRREGEGAQVEEEQEWSDEDEYDDDGTGAGDGDLRVDGSGAMVVDGEYQIAPTLAPPSPPNGDRSFAEMLSTSGITGAAAASSSSVHIVPGMNGSRPPSPSSACFRFVPAEDPEAERMEDIPEDAESSTSHVSSDALKQPGLTRSHSAPSSSPVRLLFSDHADLELIRASRRSAGCNCRGSKTIKVCGPLEDMKTDALLREAKRSVKKGATAGLRGTTVKNAKTAAAAASAGSTATPAAPATEDAGAGLSPAGGPVVPDPFNEDVTSSVELCPCYSAGIGCNSNICRCTCTSCVNPYERYYFNQRRVNAYRRKVITPGPEKAAAATTRG